MSTEAMRKKVDRLETFVNRLRTSDEESSNALNRGPAKEDLVQATVQLRITDTGAVQFVGPSHWESIIDDIAEVKAYFSEQYTDDHAPLDAIWPPSHSSLPRADIILGVAQTYTLHDLLTLLPPRTIIDRLIMLWFHSGDPLRLIQHAPTFQLEYDTFWSQPDAVSPAWLALLIATASIGAELNSQSTGDFSMSSMAEDLRRLTAHALLLANYVKPQAHIIECLLLHIKSLLLKSNDATSETYLLVGCVTRMCSQGGYHRDPRHNPNIGPLQAELRRRVWQSVRYYDIKMCYQLGLVSVINLLDQDTLDPANYTDADLMENPLPPPRPLTDTTPMSYSLAYHKLSHIFGDVISSTHATTTPDATKTERLYNHLQQARAELPTQLKMRTLSQSILDSTDLRVGRYGLEFLHLRAVCVLYQRFLSRQGTEHEQQRCIKAAVDLIRHQLVLLRAAQPGNDLEISRTFLVAYLHDFNLAAMLLCSRLQRSHVSTPTAPLDLGQDYAVPEMLELCDLWETVGTRSVKAGRALRAIQRFLQQNLLIAPGFGRDQFDMTVQAQYPMAQAGVDIDVARPTNNTKKVTEHLDQPHVDGVAEAWSLPPCFETDDSMLFQDFLGLENIIHLGESASWP
ncbi:hypothetical protein LTR62_001639 [Meristemomyces frigidus]|uniref:Xylanolytic transcriptional activator regulatory domain-containing protein n=1 Tax=Meristemomyces frigidus TaxID=1508187 RepID=A0AAN7YG56_9PEZI|nr:hypothetical protein LTR62_001639 [Meristemomyces frigidus]